METIQIRSASAKALRFVEAPPRVKHILASVAEDTGVSVSEILGSQRYAHIVKARWLAIHEVHKSTGWGSQRLGRLFNRDHATILYALKKAASDG